MNSMSLVQVLKISATVGLVVPVFLTGAWWLVNSATPHDLSFEIAMERFTVMVWPSSFALLAGAGSSSGYFSWQLTGVATIINVMVYTVLGALCWYGYHRSRIVLAAPVALVLALWFWALFIR